MKQFSLTALLLLGFVFNCFADRIFIINSSGYNTAEPQLIAAIALNGHTINTGITLPAGFSSSCTDPVNGYDWLCFFGVSNYNSFLPQVQAFVNSGGKVFCQYEVTCCIASYASAAFLASGVTGLNIQPNSNPYIAINSGFAGWESTNTANVDACVTILGAAYKGMDSIPVANQLQATQTLPGGAPPISTCLNFGFAFHPGNFSGLSSGAIVGLGDYNIWHDGREPFGNGGNTPVNQSVVDYFFPGPNTCCYLLAPGCIDSSTVNASPNSVYLGVDTTICLGDSILLSPNGSSTSYLWQDGSTNATFTADTSGIYWVEINGTCGLIRDSIQIKITIPPTLNLGIDTTVCSSNLLLNASIGFPANYHWQDNSTDSTFLVSSSGTYSVSVSNTCGTVVDSITVSYQNLPVVNLGPDTVLCAGDSILLDVSIGDALSYLWQDNSTDSTFLATSSGAYSVSISNACGTVTDSILITYENSLLLNLGLDSLLCAGDSILLDASSGLSVSYQWQNNSADSTFLVTNPGTYSVSISNTCETVTDSIIITYENSLLLNLGLDSLLCAGDSILLDANPGVFVSYQWQDNSTDSTFLVTNPGTYSVSISNACETVTDSIVISYENPLLLDLGLDSLLCVGDSILFDASSGVNANYLWQDNSTDSTFLVTNAGTYSVSISNACGSITDSITISYENSLLLNLGIDTVLCTGDSILLDANSGVFVSYQWQDNSVDSTFLVTNPGTYSVSISSACETVTDSILITYENPLLLDLGLDSFLCVGNSILLDASSGINANYLWQDNSTDSTFLVANAGTYSVTISNACGSITDSITLNYENPPLLNLGPDTTVCPGTSILLDVSVGNALSYIWQDNSTNSTFLASDSGTYSVSISNACGTTTDSITINYIPAPLVYVGNDTTLCYGFDLTLNANTPNSVSYLWSDNSTNNSLEVQDSGIYWIQVINDCSLSDTDSITVTFTDCECSLIMPDAFTPNNDGVNDAFAPVFTCPLSEFHFAIFNRWGQKVYESTDVQEKWDGKFKGVEAATEVYIYTLRYKDLFGNETKTKGDVSLIR